MQNSANKEGDLGMKKVRPMPAGDVKQPRTFHQLGIFVLDGSGSMKEGQSTAKISLAQSVSYAVRNTFSRFKASAYSNNFSFAVVYYDEKARVEVDITATKQTNDSRAYDPTVGLGGKTSIGAGLKEAKKLAEKFLAVQTEGGITKSVVIVVLSDGLDMTQAETVSVANALKSNPNITITTCFFETLGGDADMIQEASTFLKGLCSDPVSGFINTSDPEVIRRFFVASVSNKKQI